MANDFLTIIMTNIASMFGGIEIFGLMLIVAISIYAYYQKATLPTILLVLFLLIGAFFGEVGGTFTVLYGLTIVAGAAMIFLAAKQQFSNI